MGCIWSSFFPQEKSVIDPEICDNLQLIKNAMEKVRLRLGVLYERIKTPGISRERQKLLLIYIKQNRGKELALQNLELAVENTAITTELFNVFKQSSEVMKKLTKECSVSKARDIMDKIEDITNDVNEFSESIADMNYVIDDDEEELENELRLLEIEAPTAVTPKPILQQKEEEKEEDKIEHVPLLA